MPVELRSSGVTEAHCDMGEAMFCSVCALVNRRCGGVARETTDKDVNKSELSTSEVPVLLRACEFEC